MPEGEFREEIAELRTDHRLLAARVDSLGASVDGLREDQNAKHKENRRAIHELRNTAQTTMNELHVVQAFFAEDGAFDYMKKKMEAMDTQNRWAIGLLITTLVGVIVTLATKH